MRTAAKAVSFAALLLVIGPAAAYLAGSLAKPAMQAWMLGGTLAWFAAAPLWMGRDRAD